jgi:hypothetical protein
MRQGKKIWAQRQAGAAGKAAPSRRSAPAARGRRR